VAETPNSGFFGYRLSFEILWRGEGQRVKSFIPPTNVSDAVRHPLQHQTLLRARTGCSDLTLNVCLLGTAACV